MAASSLLALLAFAACGGDDDDDGGGDTTATASQSADGSGESPTAEPGDGGDGSDVFGELDELTAGLDTVSGKIGYTITSENGTETSYTVYSDGASTRFDSTDESGNVFTSITTGGTTYICDSSSESCFSSDSGSVPGGGIDLFGSFLGSGAVSAYVALVEAAGVDVETSNEEHAGTDTNCFSWTDEGEDGFSGKMCFAESGVMLYEEITSSTGSIKVEATEFSEDVSSSDFEPPYEVTEIPGA